MRMKNTSPEDTLQLQMLGLGTVLPNGEIDVPEELCRPYKTAAGGRGPSDVERMAPQLRPVDEKDLERWAEIPADPEPASKLRGVGHAAVKVETLPPGVQAAVAAAKAPKKSKSE